MELRRDITDMDPKATITLGVCTDAVDMKRYLLRLIENR